MVFKKNEVSDVVKILRFISPNNTVCESNIIEIHKRLSDVYSPPISKNKIRCIIDLHTNYEWKKQECSPDSTV